MTKRSLGPITSFEELSMEMTGKPSPESAEDYSTIIRTMVGNALDTVDRLPLEEAEVRREMIGEVLGGLISRIEEIANG